MAGYWLVRASLSKDDEAAKTYSELWKPLGEKYQAKILASRNQPHTVEGTHYPRVLVIEFPTYQMALDCYNDPDYQAALEYVNKAYDRELLIVEGN